MKKTTHAGRRPGDSRKYLFQAGLLILIAFCLYFSASFRNMQEALIREKIDDRILCIDVICDEFSYLPDSLDALSPDDCRTMIARMVESLDSNSKTYVELFNGDLNSLTERYPIFPETPFVIHEFPLLVQEMLDNLRGEMTVFFDMPGVSPHDLHIFYRWVQIDKATGSRLLLVVGISKFTLENDIAAWVSYGAIALIIITALFIVASIIVLCKLGHIYERRGGADKWRPRIFS